MQGRAPCNLRRREPRQIRKEATVAITQMCRGSPDPLLFIFLRLMASESDIFIKNAPAHVAIIMDGNGRWAKERGKPRIFGHKEGANRIREVMDAAREAGVKFLTLYAFSSENWNRPQDEVEALMNLLVAAINEYGGGLVKNKIRFRTIGDISALPQKCQDAVADLSKKTENFSESTLVLALNYGSRDEIAMAARKIAEMVLKGDLDPSSINWEKISGQLYTSDIPDPDLIIRTSGEQRLSNFLMLQAAYSELYFTDIYWPEFGRKEFLKAVEEFKLRERRYGKTADVQLSFDAYRGDETSAGKLNYAELTVPCTPNDDGFSYMRTCYDELEKALGGPFTTDVNMDGVSAEDDTDTLFAALQKDAGGENVCALQYQWRGLGENESLLYLYYYPNENGSARVKLTFLPKERAQIP